MTEGYCPICQKIVVTQRNIEWCYIILGFIFGVIPGICLMAAQYQKPEVLCTVCGTTTFPPQYRTSPIPSPSKVKSVILFIANTKVVESSELETFEVQTLPNNDIEIVYRPDLQIAPVVIRITPTKIYVNRLETECDTVQIEGEGQILAQYSIVSISENRAEK